MDDSLTAQAAMLDAPLRRSLSQREQLGLLGLLSGDEQLAQAGKFSLDLDAKRQAAKDARDAAYAEARLREEERRGAAQAQREWQAEQQRAQREWREQEARDRRDFTAGQNALMRGVLAGNQPLVQTVDPTTGQPVFTPRAQAVGQQPAPSGGGGKAPAEIQRMGIAFNALDKTVDEYVRELENFDPRSPSAQLDPTKRAKLDALQSRIRVEAKEAAALGALTGPDLGLVDSMLASPAGARGALYGREGLQAQTEQMRAWIGARRQAVADQFPQMAAPGGRGGGVLPKARAAADAAAAADDPLGLRKR